MADHGQRGKQKFTVSDALAAGTTGVSLISSFRKGLKYDPNADKPEVFNPIIRPSVGDPNIDRYLNTIDQNTASTNRALRDVTGSDQNAGILGILQNNQNSLAAKDKVYARHTELIESQEQRGADVRNEGQRFNITGMNRFKERRLDRDVRGAERADDAARESLQSGVDYFSARDASNRNTTILRRQANERIGYLRRVEKQNFMANYSGQYGFEGAEALWAEQEAENNSFWESKYDNTDGFYDDYLVGKGISGTSGDTSNQRGDPATPSVNFGNLPEADLVDLTGKLGGTGPIVPKKEATYDINLLGLNKLRKYLSNSVFGNNAESPSPGLNTKRPNVKNIPEAGQVDDNDLTSSIEKLKNWNYTRADYERDYNKLSQDQRNKIDKLFLLKEQYGQGN